MNYRLYSFVAHHYLSPLQTGLQTAHVVSELSQFKFNTKQAEIFNEWASRDKTIIICGAGNHQGVLDCHAELFRTGSGALALPVALFREDEQSMNGMATACGVIVPECYWSAKLEVGEDGNDNCAVYTDTDQSGTVLSMRRYFMTHPEGQFIKHIKGYRLA